MKYVAMTIENNCKTFKLLKFNILHLTSKDSDEGPLYGSAPSTLCCEANATLNKLL